MNIRNIALVGNPNAGKTSLFNQLTGLNQHVGNYPGITVDKKVGSFDDASGNQVRVIDLPGIYSLHAKSEEEHIVNTYLSDKNSDYYPDLTFVILDASNLERNFLLFSQLYDRKLPLVLVLNMVDVSEKEGISIDEKELSSLLGDLPVIKINARKGEGIERIKETIQSYEVPTVWQPFVEEKKPTNGHHFFDESEDTAIRYQKIGKLLKFCSSKSEVENPPSALAAKMDSFLTHPVWGYVTFLGILYVMFQAIYVLANIPMDLIDGGFSWLSFQLSEKLPAGVLTDLLAEGIIPGLGGVLIFIPQIALLFLFISVLEETGYMSRVVFIMDRLMRPFGLNGKSVVPLMSGIACAIPAIMATRTIDQQKDRLVTILVTPLMSCSARLPVYTLMIALTIPNTYLFGLVNLQGLTLLGMYLLGLLAALVAAVIFKWIIKPGQRSFLIMEMPIYRLPNFRNVALTLWEKVKVFVLEAGKIIMALAIILWVLGSYGPESFSPNQDGHEVLLPKVELDDSFIGILGKKIEPAISPLGYDWKIGISLITSFAAREVFVGSMATIYSLGEEESSEALLIDRMQLEVNPLTGERVYSLATGISLMVFYAFAMQCMSTLAIVKRETKSWKWPIIQLLYMTALAYFGALVAYNLAV